MANCSAGGCSMRKAPKRTGGMELPRKRVLHAAVDGEGAARGLGRAVRGEEKHRLRDVLGQDGRGQDVALAVEVLELLDGDALGAGALTAHVFRPKFGVAEDGVGV